MLYRIVCLFFVDFLLVLRENYYYFFVFSKILTLDTSLGYNSIVLLYSNGNNSKHPSHTFCLDKGADE